MDLETTLDLQTILSSDNVAALLSDEDCEKIGMNVYDGYVSDESSRDEWKLRYAEAMKLAQQVMETKTFPWPGASNVKFPLLTLSAIQFHARAYPALLPTAQFVSCQVIGDDPDGSKAARADRVSTHMSYQLTEEDTTWEGGTDKALLVMALVGCAFKKTYYDAVNDIKKSDLVLPKDLVVDYFANSLDSAERVTHVLEMSTNTAMEREREGLYRDMPEAHRHSARPLDIIQEAQDQRQGLSQNDEEDAPRTTLEQHCYLDLDGDGYREPYIVTVDYSSRFVRRICPRFTKMDIKWSKGSSPKLISIKPIQYFTMYEFIPSPDGGFYPIGFGQLLGALNHAVDTIINQLIDAGTMATTAGGFLGKGARLRGGEYSFKPMEWKRVDVSGEDLSKAIFPLPVRDPSPVLFQLLSMLVDRAVQVGGATDPMVGENPGQNTPAETSRNTIAEGQRVYNAIYKRTWRAMKEEYRKLYRLNFIYPSANGKYEYNVNGRNGTATIADYFGTDKGVVPVADPNISSEEQLKSQANDLVSMLQSPLGQFLNPKNVLQRVLDSRRVNNQQALVITPKPQAPPPDPKIVVAQMEAQTAAAKLQYEYTKLLGQTQQEWDDADEAKRVNDAKIDNLESQAALFEEQASGSTDNTQIALIDAQLGAAKLKQGQMQANLADIQHRRDTYLGLLEHFRNTNKDANDAANARRVE